jgi:hypothetical protein
MRNREAVGQVLLLGMVGLVWGAVAGWFGVSEGGDVSGIAHRVMAFYPWTPALVGSVLVFVTWDNVRRGSLSLYRGRLVPLKLGAVGLGGGLVSTGFWFGPATNLPAVFLADTAAADLRLAMMERAPGWMSAASILLPAGCGLLAGAWAARKLFRPVDPAAH